MFYTKLSHYIKVCLAYIRVNILCLAQYKIDILFGSISSLLLHSVGLFTIQVIMSTIPDLDGWNIYELLLLYSFTLLIHAIWHTLFTGFLSLPWLIHSGQLDIRLTRPLPVFFQICFEELDDDAWGEVVSGLILLFYAWKNLCFSYTIINIAALFLFILSGLLIYTSIVVISSTVTFWSIYENPLFTLNTDILEFMKYPLNIYSPWLRFLFTFILPFGFVSYYPACFFINESQNLLYILLNILITSIFLYLASLIWKYGLNQYQSTGN